ncbi:MAG: glycoside hydrolase family 15 protein [Cyanobacteria bacterium J06639_16]
MAELVIHCDRLKGFIQTRYTLDTLYLLEQQLHQWGTLTFPRLANGLFPAAAVTEATAYTGYGCVWVRDTVHVAHAHYQTGQVGIAVQAMTTVMVHFNRQRSRFNAILMGAVSPTDLYQRPAIKFIGETLAPLPDPWPHAQNDALGYFLWFYCELLRLGHITLQPDALSTLSLFPPYFQTIEYWRDADHGHWEEAPKVEASSIGTVLAGLRSLQAWLAGLTLETTAIAQQFDTDQIQALINRGTTGLHQILPAESHHPHRPYDSALLFLIYPLQVVSGALADIILQNVLTQLKGPHGIKRYPGDSYWCANYKQKLAAETRTADFSETIQERDRLLKPGEEAQWCLFDPIVSTIFGQKFQHQGNPEDLIQQTQYLNRALGQITGEQSSALPYHCPELYYLEHGHYVPNDSVPLLWTQANLALALKMMKTSLRQSS